MSIHAVWKAEIHAADITFVREIVCEDVHGEGGAADVHLVADVAALGVLRGQGLVGLPVSG